ncbi:TerD domain protein [Vibrio phage 1.084.O._10N.261.49.F5]|nr:TerD domain protein [Vibrio phage 1.084.O._10N.261.49.F5]
MIKSIIDLEDGAETLNLDEYKKKEEYLKRRRKNMALNLASETTGSAINTLNLSKIEKGQRINLSKEQPSLKKILMKLCWESDEDVDATVVMLNSQSKAVRPDWSGMVGYGNLQAQGISHSGDLRSGGTEEVIIELDKVESAVESLMFVATTHEEQAPATTFGTVRNAKVYLINADTNQALYEFDLEEDHSTSTAVEMARLYKKAGEWRFTSLEEDVGRHHMGLQNIVDKYFQ